MNVYAVSFDTLTRKYLAENEEGAQRRMADWLRRKRGISIAWWTLRVNKVRDPRLRRRLK